MGIFGKKKVSCPKDKWTLLVRNFASGMPTTWNITFRSKNGSKVGGKFLERRGLWVFPQEPSRGRLKPNMSFHRNWINAFYSLKVCPRSDVTAIFE